MISLVSFIVVGIAIVMLFVLKFIEEIKIMEDMESRVLPHEINRALAYQKRVTKK